MAFRAPLLGYNTNVRHKGRLYHIQTEDSGVAHPHVITHLFADGGRIVASKKTSYSEHLGADNLQETVKKLMQGQHKAMFIALRDGKYDDGEPSELAPQAAAPEPPPVVAAAATPAPGVSASVISEQKPLYEGPRPAMRAVVERSKPSPQPPAGSPARQSIFGSDLLSEKSLDEVILSYLAADEGEN